MKIALIGYGKMGKTIERIALSRGHQIVAIIDAENQSDFDSEGFKSAEVAIEFSIPSAAMENYRRCFERGVAVVAGTTGWLAEMDQVKSACEKDGQTFFYASNYSLGVNLFFKMNESLAKMMNHFPEYDVRMKEIHHIHKLDAPSGTAITLAEGVIDHLDRKSRWVLEQGSAPEELVIEAERQGEVPGYHEVRYESDVDSITIIHDAKSREGFALGAVVAAEFVSGKSGFLSMKDLLADI